MNLTSNEVASYYIFYSVLTSLAEELFISVVAENGEITNATGTVGI